MSAPQPWYCNRWPWILMAGPAIVIVAGVVTTVLAVTSFDGLVADDYYKQGLGINRVLAREAKAQALGIHGTLQFSADRTRVRALMPGVESPTLRLAIVHPTVPAQDQSVTLARTASGIYEGALRAPASGAMRLRLEDGAGLWRLTGDWRTREGAVALEPKAG